MAKPATKNLKGPFRVDGIICRAIQDLKRYLSTVDRERLEVILTNPVASEVDLILEITSIIEDADSQSSNFLTQAALRQLGALFEKNRDIVGSDAKSRKAVAMEKFAHSERKCRRTNKRLAHYSVNMHRVSDDVRRVTYKARSIIRDTLGTLSHLSMMKIIDSSGFGPGATFSTSDPEHSNLYHKIAGPHSVTADAIPYLKMFLHHWEPWKRGLSGEDVKYDVVAGNRVTTVAKTAVTDRTIAIEPSLNVFMQKGVDSLMKTRLHRVGVHLDSQEYNHAPARLGSQRPLYAATVDLSSASDNISIEAMRLLFPHDWFLLLDALRSPQYYDREGDCWKQYEKFSSMGNAFTFPVESMIFFAVAKACTIYAGGNLNVLRVYGDDIVIDPKAVYLLSEVLQFLGFSLNVDKSFAFGNFRETCGVDFISGVDLRPVYVRELPRNDQAVYNLFNRLMRNRVGFQFHNLCEYLHDNVERPFYGPPSLPAGENYQRWSEGKSVQFDHYFHAPPHVGERFKRYHDGWQCMVYEYEQLRLTPKRLNLTNHNNQLLHLTFLLMGRSGGTINSNRRFRRTVSKARSAYWPCPPWHPYLYDCVDSAYTLANTRR